MVPCQLRLMGYGCASAMEKSRTRKVGDRMAHWQPTDISIKCICRHLKAITFTTDLVYNLA